MQKLKVFLTGGNGFIGRHVAEQLGGIFDIIAPTHADLDLADSQAVYAFLEKNPVDVVLHAASIGVSRKQQAAGTAYINLRMFFNLVRAKPFFSRLINLGSGAEYGKQFPIVQATEADFGKQIPNDEYGFYKYVCSQFAAQVDYITHLRLFAVFGKYEDYQTRFVSNAICRALLDKPITIRQNVKFDYIFVDDVIQILKNCIEQKPQETFINVGRGEAMDLKSLAEKILEQLGLDEPIQIAQPGWGNEYSCDTTRLQQLLPGISYTPIDVAVAQLVAYYKAALPNLDQHALLTDY